MRAERREIFTITFLMAWRRRGGRGWHDWALLWNSGGRNRPPQNGGGVRQGLFTNKEQKWLIN